MELSLKTEVRHRSFQMVSFILLVILCIRVRQGLDLTDEMQYYGQIDGLLKTGHLFSQDLFIQQVVYILFYPFFWIHRLVFGRVGFVFFGRILMALMVTGVYLYSYLSMRRIKCTPFISSITALSLSFAIPFHGIFALSYNTVSQAIWIVFSHQFFEWDRLKKQGPVLLVVLMAFAHQTSALVMAGVFLSRLLYEGEFKRSAFVFLHLVLGALFVVSLLLFFSTPNEYIDSIQFSSGFGVGRMFFSDTRQVVILFVLFLYFIVAFHGMIKVNKNTLNLLINIALLFVLMKIVFGQTDRKLTLSLSMFIDLSMLFFLMYCASVPTRFEQLRTVDFFVLSMLVYLSEISITSGNGLPQGMASIAVAIPILTAINAVQMRGTNSWISPVLLLSLFIGIWSGHPFRSGPWWSAHDLVDVPEYRFLRVGSGRAQFFHDFNDRYKKLIDKKKLLIVGAFPSLYFSLDAIPETCMFFLHNLPSGASEDTFFSCMRARKPEAVMIIEDPKKEFANENFFEFFQPYLKSEGFSCERDRGLDAEASSSFDSLRIYTCSK